MSSVAGGKRRRRSRLHPLISARRGVQAVVGIGIYVAISAYGVSLLTVVLVGSAMGIVLGKFFCRWMCPMGAVMELLLGNGDESARQRSLYMYFKLGCPIAWAGGLLNRVSALRVKADQDRCTDCGLCDKACYVSQLAQGRSPHGEGKANASTHYSCSRCLACVDACNTGALTLRPALGRGRGASAPASRKES